MKIRSDFVSNSSSSSFILNNSPIFQRFNITKKDIVDALTDLMGEKYIKKYKENVRKMFKEHPEYENDLDRKYPNEIGPFYVYDLYNKIDKQVALELWGDLLDDWDNDFIRKEPGGKYSLGAEYDRYEKICRNIAELYHLNNYDGIVKSKKDIDELTMWIPTNEKQSDGSYGYYKKAPKDISKILFKVRKKCGILTNKDVLKLKFSRFFIHFDDNEMSAIKGFQDYGKNERLYTKPESSYERKRNKEIKNSKFRSDSYSKERIFEVLWNYWLEKGKVKSDDEDFLKHIYPLTPWLLKQKEKDSSIRYDTANRKDLSYEDLCDELLAYNGHEG